MNRRFLFLSLVVLALSPLRAQDNQDYKMELGAALGGSFYQGDFNSRFYGNLAPAFGAMARWHLNPRMAVKGFLGCGGMKGKSADVNQFMPQDPESGAVSTQRRMSETDGSVWSLDFSFEYNFWPFGLYPGYEERSRLTPFLQAGFGVAYGTVGKAMSPSVGLGIGAKYKLTERWNIGLDWSYHFTLSDKLDGVEAPLGIRSSGFRNKDHFCQTLIYLTYDLFPVCSNCNKD